MPRAMGGDAAAVLATMMVLAGAARAAAETAGLGQDAGAETTTGKEGAERVMADDRIDWADVAAVGIVATDYYSEANPNPVAYLIGEDRMGSTYLADAIASALREAFEAGLRESGKLYDEHSLALDRLLEQAAELHTLRRELARWEAVARWLGADCDRALGGFCDGFEVIEWLDVREYRTEARAATIPALAAALGLEVEDE